MTIIKPELIKKFAVVFAVCWAVITGLHALIATLHIDLSHVLFASIDSSAFLIEFAPEIWLTLLSIVLGTLIIVISIASQSNPKLIDYYIGDYPSLYYTCAITLAGIENIYLQLNLSVDSLFWKNVVFINAYLFLPIAIIGAIPYTFYILSYTKTSSLIRTIYRKNINTLKILTKKKHILHAEDFQFTLLDTINQLDDQHGFVHFKEPKSEIITLLGDLLQFYLHRKHNIDPSFFKITDAIRHDISFRTLADKFP